MPGQRHGVGVSRPPALTLRALTLRALTLRALTLRVTVTKRGGPDGTWLR
jgi:hypothetical protein